LELNLIHIEDYTLLELRKQALLTMLALVSIVTAAIIFQYIIFEAPWLKIGMIKIRHIGVSSYKVLNSLTLLNVTIKVENTFPFNVFIVYIVFKVYSYGNFIASGVDIINKTVASESISAVNVNVTIPNDKAYKIVADYLLNNELLSIKINGSVIYTLPTAKQLSSRFEYVINYRTNLTRTIEDRFARVLPIDRNITLNGKRIAEILVKSFSVKWNGSCNGYIVATGSVEVMDLHGNFEVAGVEHAVQFNNVSIGYGFDYVGSPLSPGQSCTIHFTISIPILRLGDVWISHLQHTEHSVITLVGYLILRFTSNNGTIILRVKIYSENIEIVTPIFTR